MTLVKVPIPPAALDEPLWHYTNLQGFKGIIDSGAIWASSYTRMNDLSELEYGFQCFQEVVSTHLQTAHDDSTRERLVQLESVLQSPRPVEDLFFCSASVARDSLSQWGLYGGERPVAVKLKRSTLARRGFSGDLVPPFIPSDQDPTIGLGTDIFYGWRQVLYERSAQVDLANRMVEHLVSTTLISQADDLRTLMMVIPYLKHPAFQHEQEMRYVTSSLSLSGPKFRVGPRGLTPYIELTPAEGNEIQPNIPLIEEVMLGPGASEEDVNLTKQFLSLAGFEKVKVSRSEIPFRP